MNGGYVSSDSEDGAGSDVVPGMSADEQEIEGMPQGMEGDIDMEDMQGEDYPDLLWKGVVTEDEPLIVGPMEGHFVKITQASFGVQVNKGSRTVLVVEQQSDDDEEFGVICVLNASNESRPVDLLVTEAIQLSVKGTKVSPVYLTGYYTPAEDHMASPGGMPPHMMGLEDAESIDEDAEDAKLNEEEEAALERALATQLGKRKRAQLGLENDLDEDDEDDEDEDAAPAPPATKKQKTNDGSPKKQPAKPTAAEGKKGKKKNKKNKKKQKKAAEPEEKETPAAAAKKASPKHSPKASPKQSPKQQAAAKDGKKWTSMGQGLQMRDLKQGNGKPVGKKSKVRVYYVGQHADGKVFDKAIQGKGFSFQMGGDEVIEGWEKGLKGMKVGGKRRLKIPAHLAYGDEGMGDDIKPGETLTFTIEVKGVN